MSARRLSPQKAKHMRILVVEDDAFINALTSDDFESAGYDVVSACDADAAIAVLESRNDSQVIVTDITMPGSMDGLKLGAALHNSWPPRPNIITSGETRPR